MVYPSARRQSDKAIALLSGACLYIGLCTGSVCMSGCTMETLGWCSRFHMPVQSSGDRGRIDPPLVSPQSSLFHLYFPSRVYSTSMCRVFPAFRHPKARRGLALAQNSQEPTTTMCHPQQTTVSTAYTQPSGLVPPDDKPSHPWEVPHLSLRDLDGS